MLASTTSPASLTSISSVLVCKGDRGSAISPIIQIVRALIPCPCMILVLREMIPVLADSRIPKGPISFINASIREGFAELTFHPQLRVSREKKKQQKN